jgi:hypothetical protein
MPSFVSLIAASTTDDFIKACLRLQGCLGYVQALSPGLIYLRRSSPLCYGNRPRSLLLNPMTGTEVSGAWDSADDRWHPRTLPSDRAVDKLPRLLYGFRPISALAIRLISSTGIQLDGIPVPGDLEALNGYLARLQLPEGRGARFAVESWQRGLKWGKGLLPERTGNDDDLDWPFSKVTLELQNRFDILIQSPSTSCNL